MWTSANFEEVPWLSFEPKVSKLPSAWNNCISGTFLTAKSFSVCLNEPWKKYHFHYFASIRLFYVNVICPYSKKLIQKFSLNSFFISSALHSRQNETCLICDGFRWTGIADRLLGELGSGPSPRVGLFQDPVRFCHDYRLVKSRFLF